ncbi:hypothetical protein CDL12_19131 [Handroanthus impetiginosus]|uniref:Uncharacterized protein n=1 Tax=Handroanthus impetiginosus TaxID=429701 RepID=A0A2G9GSS3_9LAMI|nr:hypothetical protein CDL12_19131 [Handroanthus impetiginosus]
MAHKFLRYREAFLDFERFSMINGDESYSREGMAAVYFLQKTREKCYLRKSTEMPLHFEN